jgi:subtilisin family serine protease
MMVSTNLSINALSILSLLSAILPHIVFAVVGSDVDVDVGVAQIPRRNLRSLTASDKKTFIVSFTNKDVSPEKRCAAIAKANGGTVGFIYTDVLNGCSITLPVSQFQAQSTITALNNRPEVISVNEDQMMYVAKPKMEDSLFTSQATSVTAKSWGLDRVDQCSLPLNNLATKQSASGVRVFILDTGVRSTHQEFTGMISTANSCHYTAISNTNPLTDGHGHG